MIKMKEKIEEMVKKALVREERERKVGEYYASELPFCIRRNYYLYMRPKKFATGTLKIFESGTLVHNWFADEVFAKSKHVVEHEAEGSLVYEEKLLEKVSSKGDFQIRGRFDNLIKMGVNGDIAVIEIKTTMNNRFVKEPKNHHKEQLNFYLYKLGMKSGYLLYVDRRNLSFKVYKVEYDKEMLAETLNSARKLHSALTLGIVPEAEARNTRGKKFFCNYCLYKEECFFEDDKDKLLKKFNQK